MYTGPNITKEGLILHLDAANTRSYPGTGTTWNDLSGHGNNGTLINGPTFDPTNNGGINFDGTNDYCQITIPNITSLPKITIEGFIRWGAVGGMFLGFTSYDVWTNGGALGYNNGASNIIGISSATVTSLRLVGKYSHYTFVMNSSGLLTNNKLYIDGQLQTITPVLNADGNAPGFNTSLRLASWNSGGYNGNVRYANVRLYNRELTSQEIQQNFNATKSRYGL